MATTTYGTSYATSADLVSAWPAASLLVANSVDAAGYYIGRGINAQTASYVGILTDAGKTVTMTVATSNTFTIPPKSSVAYVVGTRINLLNLGAGACTVTAGAGVTISGTVSALAANGSAAVVKTATNTWSYVPFGSGAPALTSADVTSTTGSPTITTSGGFTIYSYTGSGTMVLGKAGLADSILCIGGGGGGGAGGGGGGAGGYLYITSPYLVSGTNTVTVGAGGNISDEPLNKYGGNGFTSGVGQYYSPGGAGGAYINAQGQSGASGSGAGMGNSTSRNGGTVVITALGNNGGNNITTGTKGGGGGGGASAVGGNAGATNPGAGGAGSANSITGASVTYAGGGGGGATGGTSTGGAGGGAAGGIGVNNGSNGTANLGGGAGGGGSDLATATRGGGSGGSGITIIRVVT